MDEGAPDDGSSQAGGGPDGLVRALKGVVDTVLTRISGHTGIAVTTLSQPPSVVTLIDAVQAPPLARAYYGTGRPSPIIASLAHVPEMLEVALPFVGTVLGSSAIDARTKELVILRTSALLECRYCAQTHAVVALDSDVWPHEVRALRGEGTLDAAFPDERERALLDWTDAVALGRGAVPAPLVDAVKAHFGEHEIVELTLLVGATVMLNRYCSALGLPTSPATLERLAREGLLT